MAFNLFSDNNLLNFLVFLNTIIGNDKTDFRIHSRSRELCEKKYGIKFQGNINTYLDILAKEEILKYIPIRPKSSDKDIFTGVNGTIDIDKYRSFFVNIIKKTDDERKNSEKEFQSTKEQLIKAEYERKISEKEFQSSKEQLIKAEEYIKITEESIKKAHDEKIELLGFSPLENSKQIKKTKNDVQDFLELSKGNKSLIGFVDEVTELLKNIDSIEKINDNYIDVFKNIIKPMKDETDKNLKAIKGESDKGSKTTVRTAFWTIIISTCITIFIQNFHSIYTFCSTILD